MSSVKNFILYTGVGFLGAGINFILMPYLSHFITPYEYGLLSMINSYVTVLIPLIGLVVSGLIFVDYFKIKDKDEFALLFTSLQLIPLLPALFFIFINILFPHSIASVLEFPVEKSYWLTISVVISLLIIYTETLFGLLIARRESMYFSLFSVAKILIEVLLTVWFVTGKKMSWEGRLLSWLLTNMVTCLIAFIYFKKRHWLVNRVSKKYILAGLSFGLPLVLHTIGKFIINQSDRVYIAKLVSLDEAGIYNVGYQIGMVMLLLVGPVANIIGPFMFERLENPSSKGRFEIVKMSYIIVVILIVVLLLITLITPFLFSNFINIQYSSGQKYVFWTALSYFFWGIYIIFSNVVLHAKRTGFLAWVSIVNIMLNLALNYFLIIRYGAIGAAYATCFSFFAVTVIIVYKSNRLYPLPWFTFSSFSR
jgi:O-antigen/teichoic acid export membrane protein